MAQTVKQSFKGNGGYSREPTVIDDSMNSEIKKANLKRANLATADTGFKRFKNKKTLGTGNL